MTATPRETFCAVLFNGPLLYSDAIIVLSGDGETRLEVALQLVMQRAAKHVVVSGGLDDPPHSLNAQNMRWFLIEHGLAPDRIIEEPNSLDTRQQAVNVVKITEREKWKKLLLIASPYHLPRAYLTFLKVLQERNLEVGLVAVPASQTKWWANPNGADRTRLELLEDEFGKIDEFRAKGHVASYEDGLAHLKTWEGR